MFAIKRARLRSSNTTALECSTILKKWLHINCSTNINMLLDDVEEHWYWSRTPSPAQLCNLTHITLVHLFLEFCPDINPSMIILKQALWSIERACERVGISFLSSSADRLELELKRFASLIRLCLSRYRELKVHPDKLFRLLPKCSDHERSVILLVVDKIRLPRPAKQARLQPPPASASAISGSDSSSSRGSSENLDDILLEVDRLSGHCPSAAASLSAAATPSTEVSLDRQFEDDLDTLLAAIDDLPATGDDSLHQPAEDEELAIVAAEQVASGLTLQPLADIDDVKDPDDTDGGIPPTHWADTKGYPGRTHRCAPSMSIGALPG